MNPIEEEDENVVYEIEDYGPEEVALPNATASMPKDFVEALETLKKTESNKVEPHLERSKAKKNKRWRSTIKNDGGFDDA